AEEIVKRATVPVSVFIQVNIDGEASKSGVPTVEAEALARYVSAQEKLVCEGLMAIPRPGNTAAFAALRDLSARLGSLTRGSLSMGMSDDFEAAILEGATHVRVGTALFGARK